MEERKQIVSRIDARMKQLNALNLQEAEILPVIPVLMEDFHRLRTSATPIELDALCKEYTIFCIGAQSNIAIHDDWRGVATYCNQDWIESCHRHL